MINVYKVTIKISQIDGYHGGYDDIEDTYYIAAPDADTARSRAEYYIKNDYKILQQKCYMIEVEEVQKVIEDVK